MYLQYKFFQKWWKQWFEAESDVNILSLNCYLRQADATFIVNADKCLSVCMLNTVIKHKNSGWSRKKEVISASLQWWRAFTITILMSISERKSSVQV